MRAFGAPKGAPRGPKYGPYGPCAAVAGLACSGQMSRAGSADGGAHRRWAFAPQVLLAEGEGRSSPRLRLVGGSPSETRLRRTPYRDEAKLRQGTGRPLWGRPGPHYVRDRDVRRTYRSLRSLRKGPTGPYSGPVGTGGGP